MVEALGISIDKRPKVRLRKIESKTIEKIGCIVSILIKKMKGKRKSDIASPNPTRSLINFIISNYIR